MPGCTVPFCSNSTNKGFKVYHFPRDKERNLIWAKNCGRGQSWQPTDHTCVCEVHFEDSQFESHRADGKRKLKPNAIPTIFKKKPVRCYARKRKNEHVEKESVPASSYVHFILDGSTSTLPTNSKVDNTASVLVNSELSEDFGKLDYIQNITNNSKAPEIFSDHNYPKSIFANPDIDSVIAVEPPVSSERVKKLIVADTNQSILKTNETWNLPEIKSLRRKRQSCTHVTNKLKTSRVLGIPTKPSSSTASHEGNLHKGDKVHDLQCYLCGKQDKSGSGTQLLTKTDTSKLHFHQKLSEIVSSEELTLTIEKYGILCSECTVLLNYADRIEVELSNIKTTIINHLRHKTGACIPTTDTTTSTSEVTQPTVVMHSDVQRLSKQDEHLVEEDNTVDMSVSKGIQCHLCQFKTPHKSSMLFHLRQHVRTSCWCDFCQKPLQGKAEKGCNLNSASTSTSEVDKDNQQLQIFSTDNEMLNNDVEVVYEESETQKVEDNTGRRFEDSNSQVLVIPYKSDHTTSQNYELEVKRENVIGTYNICQNDTNIGVQSQESRRTSKLYTPTLSNVSFLGSALENVSVLNTCKQVETISNMEVITEPTGLESEVFHVQPKSSDLIPGKQLRSLHELGLFDVQEISDGESNVFIM